MYINLWILMRNGYIINFLLIIILYINHAGDYAINKKQRRYNVILI